MVQATECRETVKRSFHARGESLSTWARARGFKPEEVYAALSGRTIGRRGRAHKVAVALGLKPDPSVATEC